MSDKEQDEKKEKSKRQADSNESNDEEEKRSTRKKARVDYNEEKKGEASSKKETTKTEEEEEIIEDDDDDEIQDVTPTNIKSKPDETSNTTAERPTRSSSDDLMGLPMEPTGLEGAGRTSEILNNSLAWGLPPENSFLGAPLKWGTGTMKELFFSFPLKFFSQI